MTSNDTGSYNHDHLTWLQRGDHRPVFQRDADLVALLGIRCRISHVLSDRTSGRSLFLRSHFMTKLELESTDLLSLFKLLLGSRIRPYAVTPVYTASHDRGAGPEQNTCSSRLPGMGRVKNTRTACNVGLVRYTVFRWLLFKQHSHKLHKKACTFRRRSCTDVSIIRMHHWLRSQ